MMQQKVYVPKTQIKFNDKGRYKVFEASTWGKTYMYMTIPGFILSVWSGFAMVDAFLLLHYFKGFLIFGPFIFMVSINSMLTSMKSLMIESIYLLPTDPKHPSDYADRVEIKTFRGDREVIRINDIKIVSRDLVKQSSAIRVWMKMTFPIFIEDILMLIDKNGRMGD